MIDHLSTFSKKYGWLKPLFFIGTAAAFIVFGYVVLFTKGTDKDVYIIPSVLVALWSLVCILLLSIFPYVPPKAEQRQPASGRLKIRLARSAYHLGSWLFCGLIVAAALLTIKLLSIWHADF